MIPENSISEEAKNELNKIKGTEKTVDREILYYRTNKYTFNFQNFQTISTFGRDIYNGKITTEEADEDQRDLLVEILNFKKKAKPKSPGKNNKQKIFLKTYIIFMNVEKEFLMLLIDKYFQ